MIEFRLDDLFNTEATVELPNGETVVVRTLTEAEAQLRDQAGNAVAAAVEDSLRDKESERYKELIEPLQQLERDALIAVIMAIAETTTRLEVERDIPYRYMPAPKDATEEEKRETIRKQDEHEARIRQSRSEEMSRRLTALRERLDELETELLLDRATNALVQSELFRAKYEEFMVQTVHLATRTEDGNIRFPLEKVRDHGHKGGLGDKVYAKLIDAYGRVDNADPWELQKKH